MSARWMTSASIARDRMAEGNAALEQELEEQLAENRSSLVAIEEALLEEHSDELVEVTVHSWRAENVHKSKCWYDVHPGCR